MLRTHTQLPSARDGSSPAVQEDNPRPFPFRAERNCTGSGFGSFAFRQSSQVLQEIASELLGLERRAAPRSG